MRTEHVRRINRQMMRPYSNSRLFDPRRELHAPNSIPLDEMYSGGSPPLCI